LLHWSRINSISHIIDPAIFDKLNVLILQVRIVRQVDNTLTTPGLHTCIPAHQAS
jgi:hypothetical protein